MSHRDLVTEWTVGRREGWGYWDSSCSACRVGRRTWPAREGVCLVWDRRVEVPGRCPSSPLTDSWMRSEVCSGERERSLREGLWNEGRAGDGSRVSPSLWILNWVLLEVEEAPSFELRAVGEGLRPWRSRRLGKFPVHKLFLLSGPVCLGLWGLTGFLWPRSYCSWTGWFPAPKVSKGIVPHGVCLKQ